MAVNRVFGRVDGADVVLNKTAGDRWSVPVPFDVDGEPFGGTHTNTGISCL